MIDIIIGPQVVSDDSPACDVCHMQDTHIIHVCWPGGVTIDQVQVCPRCILLLAHMAISSLTPPMA